MTEKVMTNWKTNLSLNHVYELCPETNWIPDISTAHVLVSQFESLISNQ